MVGGLIYAVEEIPRTRGQARRVRLIVQDSNHLKDFCMVTVETYHKLQPEDTIWWHGPRAFWTRGDKMYRSITLKKIGNTSAWQPVDG